MKKAYLLLTSMLFIALIMSAQSEQKNSNSGKNYELNTWDLSLLAGMQNYYGDLSNHNFFPGGTKSGYFNWSAGLKLRYNLSRYFGFQGDFNYGKFASQRDDNSDYFLGSATDFDLGFFINMTTLLNPKKHDKRWYWDLQLIFGGSSYSSDLYKPDDQLIQSGNDLTGMAGIGSNLSYKITDKLDLGIDMRVNFPGHDMLDLSVRGKSNDPYGHLSLMLSYTSGRNKSAKKWNPGDNELAELEEAVAKNNQKIDSLEKRMAVLETYFDDDKPMADDDNDGVPNDFDKSPNTPEGTMVNFQGIPINEAKKDDGSKEPSNGVGSGTVLSSVFFAYNQSSLNRSNYKNLVNVAQYLKAHPEAKVDIVGHADKKGSDEYNRKLSEQRSTAVKKILVEGFGIDGSRLNIKAEGKKSSLSDKYDEVNRRVDIILK